MNAMGRLWHPLPIDVPLRVNSRRFWLWGLVAGLGSTAVIANSPNILYVDFPQFWAAGRTAGTPDLLDPARHHAWQVAHGVPPDFFPYTPGAAWLWWPFGHFSLGDGFWLHALAMTALVFAGGWLGARVYGLDVRVGLICAFAWAPSMASVAFGQNGPLGLVFALLAIEGLRRDDERLTGLGVGLLLYKPTLALPLLGLLLLRRRWLGLVVAAGVSCGWYLMSVAAAAGDWTWPVAMVNGLGEWFRACMAYNPAKSTSIPGVLIGYGVPWPVAWAVAAAVVLAALPRLLRASLVEAAAGACLVGLVVSPHSLNYEATLMLPRRRHRRTVAHAPCRGLLRGRSAAPLLHVPGPLQRRRGGRCRRRHLDLGLPARGDDRGTGGWRCAQGCSSCASRVTIRPVKPLTVERPVKAHG
jgi:hypothetical protein